MQQADGRRVELDVSKGPVKFPYVVVPGRAFQFEVVFNRPDRVANVQVRICTDNGLAVAPAELRDGVYYATAIVEGTMQESLYVTYDVKPAAVPSIASDAAFKAELPPAMRDYKLASRQEFRSAGAGLMEGSADIVLPQAGNLAMQVGLSLQRGLSYTPSAEELALAQTLGIHAYGAGYKLEQDGGKVSLTIEAYVPESEIGQLDAAFGRLSASGKSRQVTAAGIGDYVKVAAKVLWDESSTVGQAGKGSAAIYDAKNAVDGRGQVADNMTTLGNLADQIAECNPGMTRHFSERIDSMATQAIAVEAAKWGMMIAGAVLAPATFGGSLALMGVSMGIGAAMDAHISRQTSLLADAVNKYSSPKCDPKERAEEEKTDIPVAQPVWIYDPSGYVYETFPDNRIAGARATVHVRDEAGGNYVPWDAEWYGQSNPQTTDALGKYGWDVPPGRWQVVYDKAGYETTRSDELDVPPPQFEVNVPMVSHEAPRLTSVEAVAAAGGPIVTLRTDKYVAVDTLANDGVRLSRDGETLDGAVQAVDAQTDEGGVSLARTFRFVGTEAVPAGAALDIAVSGSSVVSYAGTAMADDYRARLTANAADTTAPQLLSAVSSAAGDRIELRFDEPLNVAAALGKSSFTLAGTTLKPAAADYGPDGRSVLLLLNGKLPSGAGAQVTVAAGIIADPSGNGYGGGTANVTNRSVSADAALGSLRVEGYALSPAFQADTLVYQLTVPLGVTRVRIGAAARDAGGTVRIDGNPAPAQSTVAVDLTDDEAVPVTVTAGDGATKRYYEINVVRGNVDVPSSGGDTGGSSGSGSGSGAGSGAAPTAPAKPTPSSTVVTATDGKLELPAGQAGVIALGGKIVVAIPQDAFGKPLRITIDGLTGSQAPAADQGWTLLSPVYEIVKSESGSFARPVELSFKLASLPEEGKTVAVYYYDETAQEWVFVGGELQGDTLVASIDHFTKFAAFAVAAAPQAPPSVAPELLDSTSAVIGRKRSFARRRQAEWLAATRTGRSVRTRPSPARSSPCCWRGGLGWPPRMRSRRSATRRRSRSGPRLVWPRQRRPASSTGTTMARSARSARLRAPSWRRWPPARCAPAPTACRPCRPRPRRARSSMPRTFRPGRRRRLRLPLRPACSKAAATTASCPQVKRRAPRRSKSCSR